VASNATGGTVQNKICTEARGINNITIDIARPRRPVIAKRGGREGRVKDVVYGDEFVDSESPPKRQLHRAYSISASCELIHYTLCEGPRTNGYKDIPNAFLLLTTNMYIKVQLGSIINEPQRLKASVGYRRKGK
jgi:hypothetical protein